MIVERRHRISTVSRLSSLTIPSVTPLFAQLLVLFLLQTAKVPAVHNVALNELVCATVIPDLLSCFTFRHEGLLYSYNISLSSNALWVYSKDIESLFGREKRTHTQLRQYAWSAKSRCYVRFYNGQVIRAFSFVRKQSDENAT